MVEEKGRGGRRNKTGWRGWGHNCFFIAYDGCVLDRTKDRGPYVPGGEFLVSEPLWTLVATETTHFQFACLASPFLEQLGPESPYQSDQNYFFLKKRKKRVKRYDVNMK